MEITGKIIFIGDTREVSDKFKTRQVVIEEKTTTQGGQEFTEYLPVDFNQIKVDDLNKFVVGNNVNISYNLRGRKWTNPEGVDKYFLALNGWKIDKAESATATTVDNEAQVVDESDDLPF